MFAGAFTMSMVFFEFFCEISDYTEEEVMCIVEELERQVALLRERFAGKKSFTLSVDANTPEQ